MKDERDNQISELFPAPRRRGRPSTGQAKTPAERMRAYRDRKRVGQVQARKIVTVSSVTDDSEIALLKGRISALEDALSLAEARNDFLNSEIDRVKGRYDFIVRAAESERSRLNKEIEKLKKRNVTKKGDQLS